MTAFSFASFLLTNILTSKIGIFIKYGRVISMTLKIASIWRYPVKSMMGEELNACEISENGLLGDRAYGVIDNETGKLANAKNPQKWPNMFQYRANFIEPPQ